VDDPTRRLALVATLLLVTLAACSPATSSASPFASPAAASAAASPSPVASIAPSASPAATETATEAPSIAPSAAAACPVEPQTGALPSDRLTDVVVTSTADADLVTFVFGASSIGESPAGPPTGTLDAIEPPFTEAASGLEISMTGEHVVQVRFEHMSLANDVGQLNYEGPLDIRPALPALKDVVNDDMSEGVVGWLIGWDGPGCVSLATQGREVTVAVAHAGP
jgi:hypothetical protein